MYCVEIVYGVRAIYSIGICTTAPRLHIRYAHSAFQVYESSRKENIYIKN